MLTEQIINGLLGITESYQAPQAMLDCMLNQEKRGKLFCSFLEREQDMTYEWFSGYFESEHADRKTKKQDFTPRSVSELLSEIVEGNTYFECAAGTGSIMIQAWNRHRIKAGLAKYNPGAYWYQVEELSDRAIPFLVFNMAIRGINGIIIHGDSLSRETKDVYFVRNNTADFLGFSDVIKMEHSEILERELNIRFGREG